MSDDRATNILGIITTIAGVASLIIASLPGSPSWSHDIAKLVMLLFGILTMMLWWDLRCYRGVLGNIAVIVVVLFGALYISLFLNLMLHVRFNREYWTFFNLLSIVAPISGVIIHRRKKHGQP